MVRWRRCNQRKVGRRPPASAQTDQKANPKTSGGLLVAVMQPVGSAMRACKVVVSRGPSAAVRAEVTKSGQRMDIGFEGVWLGHSLESAAATRDGLLWRRRWAARISVFRCLTVGLAARPRQPATLRPGPPLVFSSPGPVVGLLL